MLEGHLNDLHRSLSSTGHLLAVFKCLSHQDTVVVFQNYHNRSIYLSQSVFEKYITIADLKLSKLWHGSHLEKTFHFLTSHRAGCSAEVTIRKRGVTSC